jgi:hypothetical protein
VADAPQLVLDRADYQYSIDPAEIFASPKDSSPFNAALRTASRTSIGSARFQYAASIVQEIVCKMPPRIVSTTSA